MSPKIFTMKEAQALLPRVVLVLQRLQEKKKEIDLKQVEIDLMEIVSVGSSQAGSGSRKKLDQRMDDLNRLVAEYTEFFEEVESWGPVIKDIDQGLVDFYHVRNQQLVFLCWRQGEHQISHWHDLESGFGGRQALS